MSRWRISVSVILALLVASVAATSAAPAPQEAIMALEQYTTPKARALATAYHPQLVKMYENIYHCLPWVDVQKSGIGFRKPKWAEADERYLSVWILIDQYDDGRFGRLPQERRASAMFSRYGVDLIRRMAALSGMAADPDLHGFSVVLSWPKPGTNGRPGARPVSETLALFVDKATALEFLAKRMAPAEFTNRAKFFVFDGKADVGRLPLEVWEDSFVETFKLKDYQPAKGQRC